MTKRIVFSIAALLLVACAALAPFHYVSGQSSHGNRSGSGGAGTVSANSGTAGALANYAAAGGSTTVGPDATLVDNGTTLTYSGTNGIIAPVGAIGNPSYAFAGDTNTGMYHVAVGSIGFSITGTEAVRITGSTILGDTITLLDVIGAGTTNGFRLGNNGSRDLSITRAAAAGVVAIGNGTAGDTTGRVQAAGYISAGTKFTQDTGCGTIVTSSGGATAGRFTTVGSTSCTTVVTFGNTATSAHNWACFAHDLTTTADYNNPQVSSNTTTATIVTGVIASGDVIEFGCIGY